MFNTIAIVPSFLGIIVILSILLCKYTNSPRILLLIIVVASIFYQLDRKKKIKESNNDEMMINISKFIIITGILGFVVAKIAGLFFSAFN